MDFLHFMPAHIHVLYLFDVGVAFQIIYFSAMLAQKMGVRSGIRIIAGISFVNCQCLCSTLFTE